MLVDADNSETDAASYQLAVRHGKSEIFFLHLDADFLERCLREPGVLATGVYERARNRRRLSPVNMIFDSTPDLKRPHNLTVLRKPIGRNGELPAVRRTGADCAEEDVYTERYRASRGAQRVRELSNNPRRQFPLHLI